jgi:hypothetical protein
VLGGNAAYNAKLDEHMKEQQQQLEAAQAALSAAQQAECMIRCVRTPATCLRYLPASCNGALKGGLPFDASSVAAPAVSVRACAVLHHALHTLLLPLVAGQQPGGVPDWLVTVLRLTCAGTCSSMPPLTAFTEVC